MSIFNKLLRRVGGCLGPVGGVSLGLLAACVSIAVLAELVHDGENKANQAKEAAAVHPKGSFQIRCWQFGELLFEEYAQTNPSNLGRDALELHGKGDANQMYLIDTANTTCLIKSVTGTEPKASTK
jgi:hypothetical protein